MPDDYLSPDWPNSALVMIDVQNDFVDGATPIPGTAESLPAMAGLVGRFRAARRPIFHVARSYTPGEHDVDLIRRASIEAGAEVVAPGTEGARIPGALLPRDSPELDWPALRAGRLQRLGLEEYALYKPRWSAFHRTPLDGELRRRGVTTIVVAGCNLPNCPRATLFDASERDFRTVLVADATSQVTPGRLADLALIGVQMFDVADARAALPTR
ncbi:cysteine hydrolase [Gordonia sp. PP30]|uniref:cysteine hydrolase family protein n=1 Tax=Gordonia sp. PP30 TaxID=2935861 RepID=UPI001FFE4093|nr:isochorismatase family cysteine hydrolase [Gordonia sp. PP30]UQE75974.1 cysteine hydrolase [Gordonia sp. PP30]